MDQHLLDTLLQRKFSITEALADGNYVYLEIATADTISDVQKLMKSAQEFLTEIIFIRIKGLLAQSKYYRAWTELKSTIESPARMETVAEFYFLLGRSLEGMHRLEEAKTSYRYALDLSSHSEAQERLKLLLTRCLPPLPVASQLPGVLWIRIFSYLDIFSRIRLEGVSRAFNLWARASWSDIQSIPSPEIRRPVFSPEYFLGLLQRCGRHCKVIDLSYVDVSGVHLEGFGRFRQRNKQVRLLSAMGGLCRNLQRLIIPNAALVDQDLKMIFASFPKLSDLILNPVVCAVGDGRLSGIGFHGVPASLRRLSLTFVPVCPFLDGAGLQCLADSCPQLTELELIAGGSSFADHRSLQYLLSAVTALRTLKLGSKSSQVPSLSCFVFHAIGQLDRLQELCLWTPEITISLTTPMAERTSLISLELHCESILPEALFQIINIPNLVDLRLDVPQIMPWGAFLGELAKKCSRLRILAINRLRTEDVDQILGSFQFLRELCLWNSDAMSADNLVPLLRRHNDRSLPLVLTASCYHIQTNDSLLETLRLLPQFSVACYIEHAPCDLNL